MSETKYIKNRGIMRGKIADVHGTHGWHVGLECAEKILILLEEEIKKVHYSALDIDPDHATFSEGFHWAKYEILALLQG